MEIPEVAGVFCKDTQKQYYRYILFGQVRFCPAWNLPISFSHSEEDSLYQLIHQQKGATCTPAKQSGIWKYPQTRKGNIYKLGTPSKHCFFRFSGTLTVNEGWIPHWRVHERGNGVDDRRWEWMTKMAMVRLNLLPVSATRKFGDCWFDIECWIRIWSTRVLIDTPFPIDSLTRESK